MLAGFAPARSQRRSDLCVYTSPSLTGVALLGKAIGQSIIKGRRHRKQMD